jgi:hypothetical protein
MKVTIITADYETTMVIDVSEDESVRKVIYKFFVSLLHLFGLL